MQQQPYDWRDGPRFSVSSLLLLAVFVGAVLLTVYVAFQMKPWDSDAAPEVSSATEAPAAVEVSPPAEQPAPAPPQ